LKFSPNFDQSEFEKPDPIPDECVPIFEDLCVLILEAIRSWLNRPIEITSGYRSEEHNMEIHGSPTSEHVATADYCAADFRFDTTAVPPVAVRDCFDWIRQNTVLPFHQVILEHGAKGSNIIHISINRAKWGQRQALEGATYNASAYSSHDVAPYGGASLDEENV
jgi:hypothetical protein